MSMSATMAATMTIVALVVASLQPAQSAPSAQPVESLQSAPSAQPVESLQSLQSAQPAESLQPSPSAQSVAPVQPLGEGLDLRDIHLPAEPGVWPPAPGWWLLFVLIMALVLWLGRLGWGRYRRLRRRQRILAELDRLQREGLRGPALIAAVSTLLKRVALMRYPRTEVAALTGDAWLAFLDRSGGDGRFVGGAGQALADGAYAPESVGLAQDEDQQALFDVARDWLQRNC